MSELKLERKEVEEYLIKEESHEEAEEILGRLRKALESQERYRI